jgi:hypothetical protein
MNGVVDRVVHSGMLVLASVIGLLLADRMGPVTLFGTAVAQSELTVLVVFLIYAAVLALFYPLAAVPWLRRQFDPRAQFIGRYLSIRDDGSTISIFEIRRELLRPRYRLEGYSYSRSDVSRSTGTWNSELLDIDSQHRVVRYIYTGGPLNVPASAGGPPGPAKGNGYARIDFLDPGLSQATGRFVDDAEGSAWLSSTYVRIDRALVRAHLGRWRRLRPRAYVPFLASYVKALAAVADRQAT